MIDELLSFAVYAAGLGFNKRYQSLLEPLNLTYPQYLVMCVLWEADGVTVGAVGERMCLDSGTTTPLLKRLQAAGLLQRRRAEADQRVVIITLTEAGRALHERALAVQIQIDHASGLDADAARRFRAQLIALRRSLTAEF
jgi:MarR family transcriptional regulator, organic hydroperoxide resistance regulator